MVTKDPKKVENADLRHQIAKEIVSIKKLKLISEEKKEDLIQDLLAQKEPETEEVENKESKEIMKPQRLQRENHKIDKELSVKEKLNKGRKKETVPAYINGVEKKVTVIKKQIEGANADAFVWEYIEDKSMPENMVGEQLFNRNAVLNLWLNTKLPTWEQMQKIKWANNHDYFLKTNFQKNGKNMFPGCWHSNDDEFYGIGGQASCWLSDGSNVGISKDDMHLYDDSPRFGFSVRLLQG